jgi:hypothetical protein
VCDDEGKWHTSAELQGAENDCSAPGLQTSTCSAMARASSKTPARLSPQRSPPVCRRDPSGAQASHRARRGSGRISYPERPKLWGNRARSVCPSGWCPTRTTRHAHLHRRHRKNTPPGVVHMPFAVTGDPWSAATRYTWRHVRCAYL